VKCRGLSGAGGQYLDRQGLAESLHCPFQGRGELVPGAGCAQSSDHAGIYFAVQAGCGQQLVTANQQALAAAVGAYRAAYKKGLTKLEAQPRTAKAPPFPQAKPSARRGGHAG
jgi:hypothetical protein